MSLAILFSGSHLWVLFISGQLMSLVLPVKVKMSIVCVYVHVRAHTHTQIHTHTHKPNNKKNGVFLCM